MIMQSIPRRAVLGTSIGAAVNLIACSTSPSVTQLASDAALVASGLKSALPMLLTVVNVPAATVSQISQYITDISAAANAVQGATTTSAALAPIQQLIASVNAIVGVVATIPAVPSQVAEIFAAASALLPAIEAAVGLSATAIATAPMTPSQARSILAAVT
jgi:hypothetical protein